MSFKLAFKNMKKNMKDYVIYFLTLVLGVAIFYIFNSMDSQQAMLIVSDSKRQIIELMIQVLGIVSVFVSIVLAFLIIYANNFLIKRRKKEFGLYMLLGMGRKQISGILLLETVLIGMVSLGVGLIVGVFGSQLMSILTAKLFEADLTKFEFVFSQAALVKTLIYFGAVYVFVMIVNLLKTSRYKLIDLLTAGRKNEKIRIKNPILSVLLFIVAIGVLGYAYYLAITGMASETVQQILIAIGMGIVGTFLFFYSLSGFILKLVQTSKHFYMKDLNMFVIKQVDSKINTTVFSMSIICLLLFFTICIFSSAMSLNQSMTQQLKLYTPADITFQKHMNKSINDQNPSERLANTLVNIEDTLRKADLSPEELFSDYIEVPAYLTEEVKFQNFFTKEQLEEVKKAFPNYTMEMLEPVMKISDYNKLAQFYGKETVQLGKNEYAIVCNFDQLIPTREMALKAGNKITLNGRTLSPNGPKCVDGILSIAPQPMEAGTILVPDDCVKEEWLYHHYLSANYKGGTEQEKQEIENKLLSNEAQTNSDLSSLDAISKIYIYESSVSLSATVTFIGLYLGIVFLISSAAILALKELSDSSDNKERYDILRKIGADEKMINGALFKQTAIFFLIPLALAIIHSIFGIKVASIILSMFGKQDLVMSIIMTAAFIICIYGGYFIATYLGSKNIIKPGN